MKKFNFCIVVVLMGLCILTYSSSPSFARKKCCPRCTVTCASKIKECANEGCACQSNKDTEVTIPHITDEFILHRKWLVKSVWEAHVLPAMLMMSEQISAVAIQQMAAIGAFFDAKHQLESQRLLQTMQAKAHKDYQPSKGMCEFGTNTRALAASDRNADLSQIALSKRALDRQLLSADGISGGGRRDDARSRLAQFKSTYCNTADFGNGMGNLCNTNDPTRINKDLDFTAAIDAPTSLNMDFSDTSASPDETDVMALMSNLYGSDLMPFIAPDKLATPEGHIIEKGSLAYMKMRSLIAKRSVAQNSFTAQAAMKSAGTDDVQPYMQAILEEMGISEEDAKELTGERPSYSAQMELLTKTLYQTPNFYTELYDKPANIDRKQVSMQAIALMQRRDVYRSAVRREALEALWLEGNLEDLIEAKNNEINDLSDNPILTIEGLD